MNQLLELSPLIVFFVVFKLAGIYWATGALMVVCTAVMLVHRFRAGSFKPMHVITVAILLVLGSATIFLHDKRFIQMKPTVLLALTAAVFLGSTVIGKQPLARRMLEGIFDEPLEVAPRAWQVINFLWVAWFAATRGGESVCGAELRRRRMGEVQGLRHQWRHGGVHDSAGALAEQQAAAGRVGGRTPVSERARCLRERLVREFAPIELVIHDESHLHAGHAGAAGGASHFRVRIVAEAFGGLTPVARHRLVYAALADLIPGEIHALALEALPPPR